MRVGILLPGFSADADDWAIPVQQNLVRVMASQADVRVIATRYPHTQTPYTLDGARIYPLGAGAWARGGQRMLLWLRTLRLLRRLHRESPFDLLHAMWADETGALAAWAGNLLGIPVVVSVAGGELVSFDDIGYGLQRGRFSRWTVNQALHGATRVIVTCDYVRHLAINQGVDAAKIRRVVLGVDTDLFTPDATITPRPRHLIHVASLIGVKDQTTLLRAVARVPDATLDIIGEGEEQSALESLAALLGIAGRVRFVGAVHHLELPTYYQQAALHVLTSRHEGQGMVTLEAAACGVPTVGTAVGVLPDVPQLGITVPIGDDTALATAIRALLDDSQRHRTLAESAYQTVRERFTIQHTVNQLLQLYAELPH